MRRTLKTLTTENRSSGFTLIELAVVISIIFILIGSMFIMVPKIELRAAIARARGDIALLEQALEVYYENERSYPPDAAGSGKPWLDSSGAATTMSDEEIESNIMLVQYLTTNKTRRPYIQLTLDQLEQSEFYMTFNETDSELVQRYGDRVAGTKPTRNPTETLIPVYTMLDPWGSPYVYDNNVGDNTTMTGTLSGEPNYNAESFDLFSRGPNSVTSIDNGVDDDNDGAIDDSDSNGDREYYGRERFENNGRYELGDDINNFRTAK